jgi:hypothetical protein
MVDFTPTLPRQSRKASKRGCEHDVDNFMKAGFFRKLKSCNNFTHCFFVVEGFCRA